MNCLATAGPHLRGKTNAVCVLCVAFSRLALCQNLAIGEHATFLRLPHQEPGLPNRLLTLGSTLAPEIQPPWRLQCSSLLGHYWVCHCFLVGGLCQYTVLIRTSFESSGSRPLTLILYNPSRIPSGVLTMAQMSSPQYFW